MMRPWFTWPVLALICAGAALAALWLSILWLSTETTVMDERAAGFAPVSFADIDGWEGDDHGAAFAAFRRSCARIAQVADVRAKAGKADAAPHPLEGVCREALALGDVVSGADARAFFEDNFVPHRAPGAAARGFVTGYYEPEIKGSRRRGDRFAVPVYRVPDDLVRLFPDSERAARNDEMSAGRKTPDGIVPYFDRKEIEQGALAGRGLEIAWLEDWIEAFYMHVQGSGLVALEEGGHMRLAYAAKNGHPYTAIGKALIERGEIAPDAMSMDAVRGWLAAHPGEARELMWLNRSYIFFRELEGEAGALGPQGAQGVALTPGRSLAVDTSIHAAGTPVWVHAPSLDLHGQDGFARLMIAQDTGSAIRGPERGDIFWGSGEQAGSIAGRTRHEAAFTLLLPKGVKQGS